MLTGERPLSMGRRIFGYSAGSVIAAATSEVAFLLAYGPVGAGPALASAAGFVGGAVPNYVLNRRWAWSDRRGRRQRDEVALYAGVAVASYAVSVVVTRAAQGWARHAVSTHGERVLLVGGAYLAVSGVFFVVKFVLYHFAVFTPGGPGALSGPSGPGALSGPSGPGPAGGPVAAPSPHGRAEHEAAPAAPPTPSSR
jgi:putative flippase GtrA